MIDGVGVIEICIERKKERERERPRERESARAHTPVSTTDEGSRL